MTTPTPYFQTDDVTLYCGDCLHILPHLGKVDAVVTDPPYGVSFSGKLTKRKKMNGGYSSTPDNETTIDQVVVPAIKMCISRFPVVAAFSGTRNVWKYPEAAEIGGVFCGNGTGVGRWGFTCFNPVLFYGKCPYVSNGLGRRPNAFRGSGAGKDGLADKNGHPCPKPLEWMLWAVSRSSLENSTVLDPFMGSGTTGVACVKTGRKFIGIELDPAYCEIAKQRIEKALAERAGNLATSG